MKAWPPMEVNSFYSRPFCGKSCKMVLEWLSDLFSPDFQ
jgi:endogenous inhibitor of DNA gyrase (YacG/DUF329 family)